MIRLLISGVFLGLAFFSGRAGNLSAPAQTTPVATTESVDPKPEPKKEPVPATESLATGEASSILVKNQELHKKLDKFTVIDMAGGLSLREAVEYFADQYDVPIHIDEQAFRTDGIKDVASAKVTFKCKNLPVRTVLHLLLEQVDGDYLCRDGVVTVVPRQRLASGYYLKQPVDASFDKQSLNEALQELAGRSGVSIILDTRVVEGMEGGVTANFEGVPLENAVRLLADMAGQKAVVIDNALYVTSEENAEKLQSEQEKHMNEPNVSAGGA